MSENEDTKEMCEDVYPLTIIADRYSGCYSGGCYLAFYEDRENIPNAIGGGDSEEMEFWWSDFGRNYMVGKGATPQEAFDALKQLLRSRKL